MWVKMKVSFNKWHLQLFSLNCRLYFRLQCNNIPSILHHIVLVSHIRILERIAKMVMVTSMIYVPLCVACPAAIMAKRSHAMRKGIEIALLLHFLHILFVYDVNNLFLSYVLLIKKMTKWHEFAHVFYFLFYLRSTVDSCDVFADIMIIVWILKEIWKYRKLIYCVWKARS